MAKRFERHSRAKSDWGFPPSRSTELAQATATDPEPARRSPARKDTRSWCKGKTGVAHVPQLEMHKYNPRDSDCHWGATWRSDYEVKWYCRHREVCARCGKVLREPWVLAERECPLWPGAREQMDQARAEAAEHKEWWEAQQRDRRGRPLITGPQGYRRRKPAVTSAPGPASSSAR